MKLGLRIKTKKAFFFAQDNCPFPSVTGFFSNAKLFDVSVLVGGEVCAEEKY